MLTIVVVISPGGAPGIPGMTRGGGAGGMPLLIRMVITEPGMVVPDGLVPTTSLNGAVLFTELA
ncbi:Uncharacterised protein [Mycobacteroides abscessus subsp. abscessus]|nr:Uncharacterised protein [Mycobacteroides abscessus subsp. abscessus]